MQQQSTCYERRDRRPLDEDYVLFLPPGVVKKLFIGVIPSFPALRPSNIHLAYSMNIDDLNEDRCFR